MESSVKRVAVIGAGASGLPAIKCCLDEGLEPVCFERTDHIGGLWYYTESAVDGQACVMKSTIINTSKEMMCYSDFPIPKEYPNFMHNSYVVKYFNLYADSFGLRKYIRFKKESHQADFDETLKEQNINGLVQVLHVKKSSDFVTSGQWSIQVKDGETGQTADHVFDAVMICTGHHAEKNIPNFSGLGDFTGNVVHSHDYKDYHGYEDKRVVVIGIGNSGGDAAVELSRVASQVFLSTRRGSWVFNRVGDSGYPGDVNGTIRLIRIMYGRLPSWVPNKILETKLNQRFDHAMYSLKPKHAPLAQHPTINDDLPNCIVSGSIKVKPDVKHFTKTGVEFEDGTREEVDVVLLATGYIFGFPFLDKSVTEVRENKVNLYKYMFPPDLEKQTLCIIGCIQPLGAIMPISENQARLFTRVVKGTVSLPASSVMWQDINSKSDTMSKQYVKSHRHTIQVDYVEYMDEIADMAGHRPDLCALLLRDPKLALKCLLQCCTPYQYRLMGPNAWKGARNAIMTQMDRVHYPMKTRPLGLDEVDSRRKFLVLYCVLGIIFAFIMYSFYTA